MVHVKFAGKIVFVGFGSIGQGVLPLILRHIGTSPERITIVTAEDKGRSEAEQFGVKFVKTALTRENYRQVLEPLLEPGRFPAEFVGGRVERRAGPIGARTRRPVSRYLHRALGRRLHRSARQRGVAQQLHHAPRGLGACATGAKNAPTAVLTHGANPGSGVAPGQASPAQHRQGHRRRGGHAHQPRGLGQARADARHQGDAHRRTRHAGGQCAEAGQRVREYLVGGRLRQRGRAAGRTRLGHAREAFPGGRRAAHRRARAARFI